ncbi:CopG family ribbon-helix-helix protein [Caulobacter mirabilis]|uniref:Ribbon-helix-helix protein CopG domain-containing protein n=1 Tax=Caulobacter mirabilis TaxID=69666 RepID=A0A2D2B0I5_9CAUL|nr:ribbon-helix-helix protein, CopG family [Caulobacter mirabilis]ATQ43753.1 hypothetical protein CSW64_15805 [Caulobacter mirabilis]
MTVHVTIELTEDQKTRLEQLAAQEDVDLSVYIRQLAEQRLREDDQWRMLIEEGLAVAETGPSFDHQEVVRRSRMRRAELLKGRG